MWEAWQKDLPAAVVMETSSYLYGPGSRERTLFLSGFSPGFQSWDGSTYSAHVFPPMMIIFMVNLMRFRISRKTYLCVCP